MDQRWKAAPAANSQSMQNVAKADPWDSAFAAHALGSVQPQGSRSVSDNHIPLTPLQGRSSRGFVEDVKKSANLLVPIIIDAFIEQNAEQNQLECNTEADTVDRQNRKFITQVMTHTRLDSWPRIVYNLFASVIAVAFMIESTLQCLNPRSSATTYLFVDILVLFIFLFDTALNFVTPKYDKTTCDWRNDFHTIFQHQKNSPLFLIDLLSTFPVEIFSIFFPTSYYVKVHAGLRMSRALLKLPKIYSYVKVETSFPGARTSSQSTRVLCITAFYFLFWGIVPLHLFAVVTLTLVEWEGGPELNYIEALYWVVYTITSVGYGDITLPHTVQMVWAISLMLTGTVVLGIIVGWLGVYISSQDQVKSDIERGLTDMASLLDHYCVSSVVRNEILSFHMHYLENYAYERHEKSVMMLPPSMRDKIKIHIRMKLILMIPMFQDFSTGCQSHLASVLDHDIIDPGTVLIENETISQAMFFLGHGMVELEYGPETKRHIRKGHFFGEISLLWEYIPSPAARAMSYCDILRLSKEDFIIVALRYPEFESAVLLETDADMSNPNLGETILARLQKVKPRVLERAAKAEEEDEEEEEAIGRKLSFDEKETVEMELEHILGEHYACVDEDQVTNDDPQQSIRGKSAFVQDDQSSCKIMQSAPRSGRARLPLPISEPRRSSGPQEAEDPGSSLSNASAHHIQQLSTKLDIQTESMI